MNDQTTAHGQHDPNERRTFVAAVASELGRPLTDDEANLAMSLMGDKSPAVVARELAGAPITDPKKIRPEHQDAATE